MPLFSNRFPQTAAVALLGLGVAVATVVAPAHAQTVLINETFAGGNPVANTDYTLVSTGIFTGPPDYRVVNNPNTAFTNGYTSFFDHTLGTSAGQMMFFDGAASSSTRIWFQSLTLNAGVTYTFSYWGSSVGGSSLPVVRGLIDGSAIGSDLTTVNGIWNVSGGTFTVPTTGTHTLSIVDVNTDGSGNDGAIDDIHLTAPSAAPEPGTLALALGTLSSGLLIRRRRARTSA